MEIKTDLVAAVVWEIGALGVTDKKNGSFELIKVF